MKLGHSRTWLAVTSLALVLATFAWETRARTSPGPLALVHARVEGLEDGRSCAKCHGGPLEELADACGECHRPITAQLAAKEGFHGQLGEDSSACGKCHADHRGADAALVGAFAFAMAGWSDREAYDHAGLGLELGGRHDELACAECHENADAPVLAEGATRFLGLGDQCAACHEDPHEGAFARDCHQCHGQSRPFAELENFVHTPEFPLVGAHAVENCRDCHGRGGPRSLEIVAGATPPLVARGCADCHESPHTEDFTERAAVLASAPAETSCTLCHTTDRDGFGDAGTTMPGALHAAAGFALDPPHADVACAGCHGGEERETLAYAWPARKSSDCAACHDDPHGGQFDVGGAPSDCRACHSARHFDPPKFGAAEHARTAFALDGAHASAECAACHERPSPTAPRAFVGTSRECADCHASPHAVGFAPLSTSCADCHDTRAFRPATSFDHGASTTFALQGAHARAECEACHDRDAKFARPDRTLGLIAGAIGERSATRCDSCHADVHGTAFDERVPEVIQGRVGCARCHDEQSFSPALAGSFDHGLHAALPLEGAHAAQACAVCHPPLDHPVEGRTFARASDRFGRLPQRPAGSFLDHCAACHDDPHRGSFDRPELPRETADGSTSCARCHGTQAFADSATLASFDHDLWTHFPLTGEHASLACADCHVPNPDGSHQVAKGRRCADCHVEPHAGQFGTRLCETCHVSTESFAHLSFVHDRDSRFPLDARHAGLACSTCHQPATLMGGGSAVRYRPLGLACTDCHGPGPFVPGSGGER